MEKTKLECTRTFKQNIERVWYVVRDASLLSFLNSEKHFPLIVKNGKATWNVDNEFQGKILGGEDFSGKCIESIAFPHNKKLKWYIQTESGKNFNIVISLFKVTEDDTTLILWKLIYLDKDSLEKYKINNEKFQSGWIELMQRVERILKESSLNLFQYEGGVINSKMNDIWEFITNFQKLKNIAPLITFDADTSLVSIQPGEVRKIFYCNQKGFYLIKIILYDKRPNWNKWIYAFEAFYGVPKIPFQRVFVTLTKINKDECHLSIFHEFKEPTSPEVIKTLSNQKKYIINSIKDFLENYN